MRASVLGQAENQARPQMARVEMDCRPENVGPMFSVCSQTSHKRTPLGPSIAVRLQRCPPKSLLVDVLDSVALWTLKWVSRSSYKSCPLTGGQTCWVLEGKLPGPQFGVRLWESTYGRCPLAEIRLYFLLPGRRCL